MRHPISLVFCFFTVFFSSKTTAQCWDLAWSDEFNGTTLDLTKWTPEIGGGGWGNSELEYYRAENATVSSGFLTITAKQESFGGNSYMSSRLITKNLADFRYGKFEARIKLPVAKGMWPAFWMLPTDNVYGGWPRSGELDIMELIGTYPNRTYGTVHEGTAANGSQLSSGQSVTLSSGTFADDFHVFSTEWSPDLIKIYLDGVLFHTVTPTSFAGGKWAFDQRFFMILNLAVGGSWPGSPDGTTTFPQTMVVDYIRVYTSANMVVGNIAVEPTGTATYSTTNIAGATYNWTVPTGATIVNGQGTPSVSVTFSSNSNGNVAVATTTPCGTVNAAIAVTITANTWINPVFAPNC